MISTTQAMAQALRMEGLGDFPLGEQSQQELVAALQRASRDVDHASSIVTHWIELNRFAPRPADIFELATRCDREFDPREWRCAKCGSTGYVETYELHTWHGGNRKTVEPLSFERYLALRDKVSGVTGEQVVITAAARCTACALGRRRAQIERDGEESAPRSGHRTKRREAGLERASPRDLKALAGGDE